MAKKKNRRVAATGAREHHTPRRRSRLPIIVLSVITAVASLALVASGVLGFGTQH